VVAVIAISRGFPPSLTEARQHDEGVLVLNRLLLLLVLACAGCDSDTPAKDFPDEPEASRLATAFDPAETGTITGRVSWEGPVPDPPPFLFCVPRPGGVGLTYHSAENPNRPRVDPQTRAVAGAVVFLRGVELARARPWDLPPVSVEMAGARITVLQGERRGRVGFVRRDSTFTATAAEPVFHILRGRGGAYFSITLPEPGSTATRRLPNGGRVELSSGTGMYWARADLFVADHPYYTVTDADGRFVLDRVPSGRVEVFAWLPGWETASQQRNPDTVAVTSMTYTPPIERTCAVEVQPGRVVEVRVSVP
jgi:hypothetical protein